MVSFLFWFIFPSKKPIFIINQERLQRHTLIHRTEQQSTKGIKQKLGEQSEKGGEE